MRALLAVFLCACSGTQFPVVVLDRAQHAIEHASVLLYDQGHGPCGGAPIAGQGTDAAGKATISARWCGGATLVASASGYLPVWQDLDTCHPGRPRVVLELRPAEAAGADEPNVVAAKTFFQAVRRHDLETVNRLLLDPRQTALYEGTQLEVGGDGCEPRFVRVLTAEEVTVELAFQCDDGCGELWRVRMVQTQGAWRVHALTPVSSGLPRLFP